MIKYVNIIINQMTVLDKSCNTNADTIIYIDNNPDHSLNQIQNIYKYRGTFALQEVDHKLF